MGNNTLTSDTLKANARDLGADLVGIASAERFSDVPPEHNPLEIFPECRSVVVIGKRIPRGSLRGVEEGTQFGLYRQYGYNWLDNRFLATTTYKTAEFLEDHGSEAVPLPNLPPQMNALGVPVKEGKPAPNVLVDFDRAAVRAGLGEIDAGSFFISPEYGTRQRIQLILTQAELEPDPLIETPINNCSAKTYASFCPLNAIDPEHTRTITICTKHMEVADIDLRKCRECKNGAVANMYHSAGPPDRIAAVCGRSALNYLEKNSLITNTFKNPFRKRPPWNVSFDRVYQEAGSDIE